MKALITSIFFSLLLLSLYAQRPGDLYTDFGDDGIYYNDWADSCTHASSLGILSDRSLIITGHYGYDDNQIYALKLDDEGNPMEFGNFPFGFEYDLSDYEESYCVAILPDNKILMAGNYYDGFTFHPFIIRLLPDGNLDPGFSNDGVFAGETISMSVNDIDIFHTGGTYNVVISGVSEEYIFPQLLMLNEDGDIVTTFGTNGIVQATDDTATFYDIAIDSENSCLYACGYTIDPIGSIIAKYNLPDGIPNGDFGIDGVLINPMAEGFEGATYAIIHDQDNDLLTIFGEYLITEDDWDIFAYRMKSSNGTTDSSFGVNGTFSLRIEGTNEHVKSAIRQSDGKYYFGGQTKYGGDYNFLLGRINHNGTCDTTFGINGMVITDIGISDFLKEIALNPSGEILYAAGYSADVADGFYGSIVVSAYYTTGESTPPIAVTENNSSLVTCYPNPSLGMIILETGIKGPQQVQVFDIAGKEVYNVMYSGEKTDLNLSFLQPSVYIIKVTLPDKLVRTSTLVIQ